MNCLGAFTVPILATFRQRNKPFWSTDQPTNKCKTICHPFSKGVRGLKSAHRGLDSKQTGVVVVAEKVFKDLFRFT